MSKQHKLDKEMVGRKTSYYVEYIGWKPSRGLSGVEFTEPVVRDLLRRRKHGQLPKLSIQVSRKELKVSRDVLEEGKRKKIRTVKYPAIPCRDVTFVTQALEPNSDIAACIYLGYNPKTASYVHVHAYRCDSSSTASLFVRHLQLIMNLPEYRSRMEKIQLDMVEKGIIEKAAIHHSEPMTPRSPNSNSSNDSPDSTDDIDADLVSLHQVSDFDSITEELRQRLTLGGPPLLLPPKDYDTISRARGNLQGVNKRKCLTPLITGNIIPEIRAEDSASNVSSSTSGRTEEYRNHVNQSLNEEYLYPVSPRSPRSPRHDRRSHGSPDSQNIIRPYSAYESAPNRLSSEMAASPNSPRGYSPYDAKPARISPEANRYTSAPGLYNGDRSFGEQSSRNYQYNQPNKRGIYYSRQDSNHSSGSGPDVHVHHRRDEFPQFSNKSPEIRGYVGYSDQMTSSPRDRDDRPNYDEHVVRRPKSGGMIRNRPDLVHSAPSDVLSRDLANAREDNSYYKRVSNNGYHYREELQPVPGSYGVRRVNSYR